MSAGWRNGETEIGSDGGEVREEERGVCEGGRASGKRGGEGQREYRGTGGN